MSSTDNQAVNWRISSFCASGECIKFAKLPDGRVALLAGGATIICSVAEFDAFVSGVKAGECDDLIR